MHTAFSMNVKHQHDLNVKCEQSYSKDKQKLRLHIVVKLKFILAIDVCVLYVVHGIWL